MTTSNFDYNKVITGGDDIRFTEADGTNLDYWIETWNTSGNSTFWVEVATSDTSIIYMYYGNPFISSASNFDNTFIFGDPFDNAALNTTRWTTVDGNPTYSIDATNHYLEITDMDGNNWENGKGFHSKTISLPSEWIIEDAYSSNGFSMYHHSTVDNDMFEHIFSLHHTDFSSADWGISFFKTGDFWNNCYACIINMAGVGGNDDYNSGEINPSPPVTYAIKLWKLSGNIHITQNGTERVNESNSEIPDRIHLGIERHSTYSFGTKRFYAFKVRKYSSPEPTATVVAVEEKRPGAPGVSPSGGGGMMF